MGALNYGDYGARLVSQRIATPVASVTALKAMAPSTRVAGMLAVNTANGQTWRFHASSSLTGDDILVATPDSGSGRWLLVPGAHRLQMTIAYTTADAAALLTVPTGCYIVPLEFWWQVSTSFTGGTNSAIGLSSNKTGFDTKGDLLGGATGDVLATLAAAGSGATPIMGTIGAGFDTLAKRRTVLVPTNTVRFDRVTSVFTAGAGTANMSCIVLANNGA